MHRFRGMVASVVVGMLWCSTASGEALGPLLPKGTFELGAQERWIERAEVNQGEEIEFSQYDLCLLSRWGMTEFATISIEGMAGVGPWLSDDEDTQLFYLLGGSVQATIWRNARVLVTGTYSYSQTVQRYESTAEHTLQTYSQAAMITAQTDFRFGSYALTTWAGPVASLQDVVYEESPTLREQSYIADSVWGATVGFSVLLFDHVNVSSHLLWIENPQPRVSVLYRF